MTISRQHQGPDNSNNRPVQVTRPLATGVVCKNLHSNWNALLVRAVKTTLYHAQIFILDDYELEVGEPIYTNVKDELKLTLVPESDIIRWWRVVGRKKYNAALNSKRQTLSYQLSILVMKKFKSSKEGAGVLPPPPPDELYSRNDDGQIVGLRENREVYMCFLKDFAKAVYGRMFNDVSSTNELSNVLTPCLEAFLVVAYENGYEVWKHEVEKHVASASVSDDDHGASSPAGDGSRPTHKFTSSARKAKKGEGWTEEAYDLYDELFETIESQRTDPNLGPQFDREYLLNAGRRNSPLTTGNQRRRRNNWANRTNFQPVMVEDV